MAVHFAHRLCPVGQDLLVRHSGGNACNKGAVKKCKWARLQMARRLTELCRCSVSECWAAQPHSGASRRQCLSQTVQGCPGVVGPAHIRDFCWMTDNETASRQAKHMEGSKGVAMDNGECLRSMQCPGSIMVSEPGLHMNPNSAQESRHRGIVSRKLQYSPHAAARP